MVKLKVVIVQAALAVTRELQSMGTKPAIVHITSNTTKAGYSSQRFRTPGRIMLHVFEQLVAPNAPSPAMYSLRIHSTCLT